MTIVKLRETFENGAAVESVVVDTVAGTCTTTTRGVPTVRSATDGELALATATAAERTATAVESTLSAAARAAYSANRTYLGTASPTNAQVAAQVRALTRQVNALIRLAVLRDLLTDETVD